MSLPINQGRFGDQFRNLFGIKGHVGLALLNDVMPVMDVHCDVPEALWTRDEQVGVASVNILAGAGLTSVAVASNESVERILIVEAVRVACLSGVKLGSYLFSSYSALGSLTRFGACDSRQFVAGGVTSALQSIVRGGTAGAWGSTLFQWDDQNPPGGVRDCLTPWVIHPGYGLAVFCPTVNTAMNVSFRVRERHYDAVT